MEHLQRRQGRWRYRRRWPVEVVHIAKGNEFVRALGTDSRERAKQLRAGAEMEFNARVRELRAKLDKQPRELDDAEAQYLVSRWYREQHDEMSQRYRSERLSEADRYERSLEYEEMGGQGPWDADTSDEGVRDAARRLLADANVSAIESGPGYGTVLNLVHAGLVELERQGTDLYYQKEFDGPSDPILSAALSDAFGDRPQRTLGDLIEAHRADKEGGWSRSTVSAYKPVHRLLMDTLGASRPLGSIGRQEGRELWETVKALPKSIGKRKELKGLTVPAAVKKGRALGLPTISPKTINDTYMGSLRTIFQWGVSEGWMTANPVQDLRVDDPTHDADRRKRFTDEQLVAIFGNAPWTPRDEAPTGKPVLYWIPVLALFHGLRRGEACGLLVEDVVDREGVPAMLIRRNRVRGLKTKHSRRVMPVHPEAIRLGFLELVDRQRADGHERVFPHAKEKARGDLGYNVTNWFSAQLRELGIKRSGQVIHSFRHNFKDRLREAGVTGELAHALTGHRPQGVADNYGSGFSTGRLRDAIEKVEYPGLRLEGEL